jgi:hypothetical protein
MSIVVDAFDDENDAHSYACYLTREEEKWLEQ